jgi:hypothetical protein
VKVEVPSIDLIDQSTYTSRIIYHHTIPQLDTSRLNALSKSLNKSLVGSGTTIHSQAPENQQEVQMARSKAWKKDAVHTRRRVEKKRVMNISDDSEIDVTL